MAGAYIDLGNPVSDHPLNRGLLLWWQGLPNNSGGSYFFDLMGRNSGALLPAGDPTWTTAQNGMPAVVLDGSNDYADSDNPIGLSGAYSRTLSGYVQINGGGSNSGILRIGPLGTAAADFSIEVRSGTSAGFNGWFNDYEFTTPATGTWYHVAITYDGSLNSAYVNGILANSQSMSLNTTDVGLVAGSSRLNADGSLNGSGGHCAMRLSTAMLHSRALSASQVWQLYDQTRRRFPDTLRRYSRRAYLFGSGGGAPPAGNRRRRILLGAA